MIPDKAFVQCMEQDKSVNDTNGYVTMFLHYLLVRAVNAPLLDAIKGEHEHNPIVLEVIQVLQGNTPTPAHTLLEDWKTDGALIWYQV